MNSELVQTLTSVYLKQCSLPQEKRIIPITIRTFNEQLKICAAKAGIRGKRISSYTFRKTIGREVWKRNNFSEASLVKLSQFFRYSSIAITWICLSTIKEEVEILYDIQDLFVY